MIVVSFETAKSQKEIEDRAVEYFVSNAGLEVTEQGSCCITFGEAPKSYIMVTLNKKDGKTVVDVESREHEYWAKKFVEEFKQSVFRSPSSLLLSME